MKFGKTRVGWERETPFLSTTWWVVEANLLAVVGGVLHTEQVLVGPAVQVRVLPADVTVAGVARLALAAEHGVGEDAQVDAVGFLVAVVAAVRARVARRAHLERTSSIMNTYN